jgi:hypothetical protein
MAKHSSHILEMARKGAEHRYEELRTEIAALLKNFPHLGGHKKGQASRTRTAQAADTPAAGESVRARKRRTMSAAARKAVSDRMKSYWAARRAGRKKK